MQLQRAASAALLLLLLAGAAQAGSILNSVSEHPVSVPLTSTPQLKQMISDNAAEMAATLEQAGYGPLFPLIKFHIDRYPQSAIERVYYNPGQTFEWMICRRNGQGPLLVSKDVSWGGKERLLAFEFFVYFKDWRHTVALLPGSGNLALKESLPPMPGPTLHLSDNAPISRPVQELPKETVPPRPAEPAEVIQYVDRPVEVVKEVVKYVDRPVRTKVVKYVDRPVQVVKVEKVPVKVVKYVDRPVQVSAPAAAQPVSKSKTRFVADMAYLNQPDPADYGMGRFGIEHAFNQCFSFMALAGGAVQANGSDGENAALLDFILQRNFCSPAGGCGFFAGAGLGGWMTSGDKEIDAEDSDVDLIVNFGARFYGQDDQFNVSLLLEGRAAVDELDSLSEYGRFGGGLRFRF